MSRAGLLQLVPSAPPVPVDETALALDFLAGDPGAERAVWDHFSPKIRRVLERCMGPEHDADDAVQEVFIRLFQQRSRLREPAAIRSYLLSIAMNVMRGELRRRKVRRFIGLTHGGELPDQETSWGRPEERLAMARFYAILDGLTSDDRAVFVLRNVEELELSEIAAALDMSLSTVKRRYARALDRVLSRARRDPLLCDRLRRTETPGADE